MFTCSFPYLFKRSALAVMILAVVLGVFFRMARVDYKIFWHDEVYTAIRSSGYVGQEVSDGLFQGQILSGADIRRYQQLSPDHGWGHTLHSLTTHPEHPPLYYLMVRGWMEGFGSSIAAIRSLSVFLAILALPALYWLWLEVFQDHRLAQWAIALFALSPIHVLYAQEARQYSLWTLTTILASAALVRSLRHNTLSSWALYGLTTAAGIYTSLFSVFTLFAQGIAVIVHERWCLTWKMGRFAIAACLACLSFTPWAIVLITNWDIFQDKTAWTRHVPPLSFLANQWMLHLTSTVVDWRLTLPWSFRLYTYGAFIAISALALVGVRLLWQRSRVAASLALGLILIPYLGLAVPDVLFGGQRSVSTRYFVSMFLGIQMAIAYATYYFAYHPSPTRQQWGRRITAILLTVGLISCAQSFFYNDWWNKGVSSRNAVVADVLNQSDRPLVIHSPGFSTLGQGDVSMGNLLSISHRVNENVRFLLVTDPIIPEIPEDVGDRYLYYPSDNLVQGLEDTYGLTAEPLPLDNVPLLKLVDSPGG